MRNETIRLNGEIYNRSNIEQLHFSDETQDSWRNAIYNFLKNWFDNSGFIIVFTSGSTGKPKEIKLTKKAMRSSAEMTNRFFGLNAESTALLCLQANYIAGKMMLVRAIVGGFNLIAVEPKANPFENINTKIDFAAITPYQLNYSADTLKTNSIRNIIVGGGHVNSKMEEIAKTIPARMFETYGMTETCSHIALRQFNGIDKADYFTVLEGVSIRTDERNCLVIHAPHLHEREIVTNDFVEIITENSFRWLGRFDTTINTGGVKVHPEQIEKKLEGIISTNFFIISLPDEVLENKVIIVMESNPLSKLEEKNLRNIFMQMLDKYEVPKQIYYLPEFIFSSGNKVLRQESLAKALKF
jgi:O-succinylbenzoic acid--CoA ligase